MKPVFFRGSNYDPLLLSKLITQGHREFIPKEAISDISSHKTAGACLAVKVDGVYHLLTGAIDKTKPVHQLVVIPTYILKKALQPIAEYGQRQQLRREETGQDTSRWGAHIHNQRFNNR